jgi:formate dehydrogenase subunit gamma
MDKPRSGQLTRYSSTERMLHWLVVLAFVCVSASGLALFHPSLYFLSVALGGGPWSVLLHPFAGLAMALGFYVLARRLWQANRLEARDRAWLKGIRQVLADEAGELPEAGRYNGGQKVLFHALVLCIALLLLSGIVIWRAYFAGFFPAALVRLSVLLHALAAFVLLIAVIVHIAAAAWVRGSLAAMIRGGVSLGWAYKHHRAWFREMIRPGAGR